MPLPTLTLTRQIWEMYKKAEASFWTAEEIDLIHDHKVRLVAPRTHGRVYLRVVVCRPPTPHLPSLVRSNSNGGAQRARPHRVSSHG